MGAYPYLDNLKIAYGSEVDSTGSTLTVSYSSIPLISNIADAEQLAVVWFSPALTDGSGSSVQPSSLAAEDVFSAGVIPASCWTVDTTAKTITIDQTAVQTTPFVTSTGQTLFRAKVVPSDDTQLTIQRNTPLAGKFVDFVPGSRLTPGQLNLADDQLFHKIQELTKQADDLFGAATVTGVLDDGISTTNVSQLGDVSLSPLSVGDQFFWDGANWTNGALSISNLNDVADAMSPSVGQVLTWDGSKFIAADPTGDGNVYVNSINGATGDVTFTMADLTNDAGYLTTGTLPTDVSFFVNDAGYITAATAPVRSVNGLTGDVVIDVPSVIDDLDDVDTTTVVPSQGQALRYDTSSGAWKPGATNQSNPTGFPLPSVISRNDGSTTTLVTASDMHNGGTAQGSTWDLGYVDWDQRDRKWKQVYRRTIDMPWHLAGTWQDKDNLFKWDIPMNVAGVTADMSYITGVQLYMSEAKLEDFPTWYALDFSAADQFGPTDNNLFWDGIVAEPVVGYPWGGANDWIPSTPYGGLNPIFGAAEQDNNGMDQFNGAIAAMTEDYDYIRVECLPSSAYQTQIDLVETDPAADADITMNSTSIFWWTTNAFDGVTRTYNVAHEGRVYFPYVRLVVDFTKTTDVGTYAHPNA